MDHHCLERAAIRVKMNILHAQTRACTRTLKMNFFLDAVHQQGTPRAGHLGSVCSHKFAKANCYGFSVCYYCYLNYTTFRLPHYTLSI